MYLETLRYFAGKTANFSSNDTGWIAGLNGRHLEEPVFDLGPAGGFASAPHCAKPNVIAISTGVLSFDHDQFGGAGSIGVDVNAETDAVGTSEGINGQRWYAGSVGASAPTDVCTSLTVNNLSSVTGICPEAGGSQGSFKIAGLASFAHKATTVLQSPGGFDIPPVDTLHGRAGPADSVDQSRRRGLDGHDHAGRLSDS